MARIFTAILFSLVVLPLAHAEVMNCKFTDTNGDTYENTFTRTHSSTTTTVTSVMKFNGVEMPALHDCMTWAHGNIHMGGEYRCPHGMDEIRFEVYPVLAGNYAKHPLAMRVIRWNGDQLFSTIETGDCK